MNTLIKTAADQNPPDTVTGSLAHDSLLTGSTSTRPLTSEDAEVDLEVLKAVPKQFSIDSEKAANWLVRKILSARQYAAAVKEWATREQRRAEREEQTLMFLFGRQLEAWAMEERKRRGDKRKSVPLPAGTVAFYQVAGGLVVDDEGALLHWAKAHLRDAVVVTERVSKATVKEHFKGTGELPDGTHAEPAVERMSIRAVATSGSSSTGQGEGESRE